MVVLLPRLPAPAAEALVRRFLDQGLENWPGFNAQELPEAVRFAATGGTRITDHQLRRLRDALEGLARKHGYGAGSGRVALAGFDAEAAASIAQEEIFASGEALRDDVWNFVGAVLAPDIVHWRFGASMERYAGGVRNTFQRLWMRGRALDRGAEHADRWLLLEELTEDALVQITERPSVGGDPILALAIGEAWLRASKYYGKSAMESVMRRAVLRIRIRNEIRSLAELPARELTQILDQAFGTPASEPASDEVPVRSSGSVTGAGEYRVVPDDRVAVVAGGTRGLGVSQRETVERIRSEAERRGWLSPKSRLALGDLEKGVAELGMSERNALQYLLGRMSDASVLKTEVDQVRTAISAKSETGTADASAPSSPPKRRWAIWRER